jgi:hypothetical protein
MKRKTEDISGVQVNLRPFPYPFKAGLAICSDIDGCDKDTFLSVHRYLNDQDKGLGLPVADSFFGLSRDPGQLALCLDEDLTLSPHADFLEQAIKDGLIDSIHSWGDFNDKPPDPFLLRRLAERVTKFITDHDLAIKIWINHGTPNNYQNIKARIPRTYHGDDPATPYYTADLLRGIGVKYYWWSELLSWPLSGRHLPTFQRVLPKLIINYLKNIVKIILRKNDRLKSTAQIMNLAVPNQLADGSRLMGFTRFNRTAKGLWALPTRNTLHRSLEDKILDDLIKTEGYLILYTHLGLPKQPYVTLFTHENHQTLAELAERHHNGSIWVTRTVDLLTYWMAFHFLVWRTYCEGDTIIIDLEFLNDPTTGPRIPIKDELAGLCFYSARPKDTVIRLDGRPIDTRVNPPDHTNKGSIGIPEPPPPGTDLLKE